MQQLLCKYLSTLNLANLTKHKYCTRTLTLEIAFWVLKQLRKMVTKNVFYPFGVIRLKCEISSVQEFGDERSRLQMKRRWRWSQNVLSKDLRVFTQKLYTKCLKIVWKLFERDCLKLFLIMISQCNSHVLNEKDAFKVIRIWPRFVAQVLPELWNFSKSGKFERHDLLLRSFENKVR